MHYIDKEYIKMGHREVTSFHGVLFHVGLDAENNIVAYVDPTSSDIVSVVTIHGGEAFPDDLVDVHLNSFDIDGNDIHVFDLYEERTLYPIGTVKQVQWP
ncbi:MAG: hypothetical protein KDB18_09155 [Salinibacterium sp.]|nr:hypothetical protein [Salinibacterium sp.]